MLWLKNKNVTYWCCQLAGWGGMMLYELINFLGMGYSWTVKIQEQFLSFGLAGILLTHGYRKLLRRIRFWQQKTGLQLVLFFLFTLLISTLLFLLSVLLETFFSNKPIPDLMNSRTLMFIVNWSRYVLVWMLCYHASKLFERNVAQEAEKSEMLVQTQLLELEVLRSQINPHFLFNTLNSIRSLINSSPVKAREAATLLSEVLRYTLNYEKSATVFMAEELDMVEKYLLLEKLRFEERLLYRIEILPDTAHLRIPPVLVLTLVENAIKHGINQSEAGGLLEIRLIKHKSDMLIIVENSGHFRYMGEAFLGKGLLNTQKRLELVYPGRAAFTIRNSEAHKVIATVKIPLQYAQH